VGHRENGNVRESRC